MPKVSESFGGKWLKALDVGPRGLKGIIDEVTQEEVGNGDDKKLKLIVWIRGQDKGLVLNVTNANDLASIYGDDTEAWNGKRIVLKADRVMFQGKSVDGIRINMDALRSTETTPSKKPAAPVTQEEADDDIPF